MILLACLLGLKFNAISAEYWLSWRLFLVALIVLLLFTLARFGILSPQLISEDRFTTLSLSLSPEASRVV